MSGRTHCFTLLSCVRLPTGHLKLNASVDKETDAHLAIAGEGGIVKQEVGTKEEDNSIKDTQARPVQEHRPAQQGVFCYVSERRALRTVLA